MSIFARIRPDTSLDELADAVLRSAPARFGGEDDEEDEDEDAGEPSGGVDASIGESEDEDLDDEDEDLDDFEEVETGSTSAAAKAAGSTSSASHTASTAKAKTKAKKKKKKKTCADWLRSINKAKTRMWSYNLGDPEREHWEKVAVKRREKMARAGCSGVPLI